MTPQERWLTANDKYLSQGLAWLRNLLTQKVEQQPNKDKSQPAFAFIRPNLAEFDPIEATRRSTAEGTKRGKAAATESPPALEAPALAVLARALGLSEFEARVLFLSAASEFDNDIPLLCARALNDPARPFATFGLAFTLFDDPAWDAMSQERPLRYWRLVEINQPGAQPLTGSALKADERIINFIKGLNYLDDRLAPLLDAVPESEIDLPPSQTAVADDMESRVRGGPGIPVCQLVGNDSVSKRAVAAIVCKRLGLTAYRIAAENIPQSAGDFETCLRLWQRETALLPVALYIDARHAERDAGPNKTVERFLSRCQGLVFLDVRDAWPEAGRESAIFDVSKPLPAEQLTAWTSALGKTAPQGLAERLAGQFNLNLSDVYGLAASALAAGGNAATLEKRLWRDCLNRLRPALDRLGQAVDAKATSDMLVLPDQQRDLLRQIVNQVANRPEVYDDWGFRNRLNRGLGISVLFAGDSGTGKTMAAEVIAGELGLILYRIDLSGVVSKFIGETEKNLRQIFDAAEDGGAVLFFDEADALFGTRSEVKDSHDRYANIEINYLLQRIESYRGLAILASNMKKALDQAFLRRLRFIVNFPHPGAPERLLMWSKAFPPETPVENLDFPRLARLNLTGGSINSIVLNAAFLAAQARSRVTMPIILDAARAEFRKLEKPVSEADFRLLEAVGAGS
jgi:SpoVK/Ycf46/Vps4 family AAA+-type ATPase